MLLPYFCFSRKVFGNHVFSAVFSSPPLIHRLVDSRCVRSEMRGPLARLFQAYVGQRPPPIKIKTFEDMKSMQSLLSLSEFLKLVRACSATYI
jgi:hypothetical protein